MSDEKQEAIREEERERAGHTVTIRYFDKKCAVCGKPFVGVAKAKFCSPKCRRLDWEKRHPENRKQRQAAYNQRRKRRQPENEEASK